MKKINLRKKLLPIIASSLLCLIFCSIPTIHFFAKPQAQNTPDSVFRVFYRNKTPSIFLSRKNPDNPLSLLGLSISYEIKTLSNHLAEGSMNDYEKILNYVYYISQFKAGDIDNIALDNIVNKRTGLCGDFSNLLIGLATAQGFKSRHINLHNYPIYNGHTVVEIFIDNKWHLYDPTFGAFYVHNDDPKKIPLSFDEIKSLYENSPHSIKIIATNKRTHTFEAFTGKDIFINATPAGPIGPNHPMIFPLKLSLSENRILNRDDMPQKFQGADYIGAAYANQHQEWILEDLTLGKNYEFIIYPYKLFGDLKHKERIFKIKYVVNNGENTFYKNHIFDFNKNVPPLVISFTAEKSVARINISHDYNGSELRYIQIGKYEAKAV